MTLFGSTYFCESMFGPLNFIKGKYCTRLTDEHTRQLLRIALSQREIDFMTLVREKAQLHVSH